MLPPEGTLIKVPKQPIIYWVLESQLRPVSYHYYVLYGLDELKPYSMPEQELKSLKVGPGLFP